MPVREMTASHRAGAGRHGVMARKARDRWETATWAAGNDRAAACRRRGAAMAPGATTPGATTVDRHLVIQ